MREFFDRLNIRIAEFMQDRYGMDSLNKFLLILGIIVLLITTFIPIPFVGLVAWAILIFVIIRALSRDHAKRGRENEKFQKIAKGPKTAFKRADTKWKNRKTTTYFKCKQCGALLSVPKGKGKLRIICPKCGAEIYKTT